MKIVLLPGMDGTGVLFDPFIELTPAGIDVISFPLKQSAEYDYTDHAKYVMNQIGDEPVVIVAESYSGMIAYEMFRLGSANIKHIVFAASFITRPSALATFAIYLPFSSLKHRLIPRVLLGKILFGKFSSDKLTDSFYRALDLIEYKVLKQRLRQIAYLQEPNDNISVPCTYIRPTNDNLVSKDVIKSFARLCNSLNVCEIEGTHFVLQTNPCECWQIIQQTFL